MLLTYLPDDLLISLFTCLHSVTNTEVLLSILLIQIIITIVIIILWCPIYSSETDIALQRLDDYPKTNKSLEFCEKPEQNEGSWCEEESGSRHLDHRRRRRTSCELGPVCTNRRTSVAFILVAINTKNTTKLELWGGAQREATRHCASEWGHNSGKGRVKIPLVATPRVRKAVTLAYTARTAFTVGGSNCAPITF